MKQILLVAFIIVISCNCWAQKAIFVAINGDDNNQGTAAQPLRTIKQALEKAATKSGNIIIQIEKGTYYLDETVRLEKEKFNPSSLTIKAKPNQKVVISAGRKLLLNWEPYKDGIFMAKVPNNVSFERLYVNDELQVLARYPNFDATARVFHGTASDAISPERVKMWKNPVGGYVHALHLHEWGGFHYRITGKSPEGELELEGGWQNNRPSPMHKDYRFVENIFEELDAPGEWFLDRSSQVLYYFPPKGVDLSSSIVEVSQLKNSFELVGSSESPLKRITFANLYFKHNERSFMDTKEPLLRSDWTIYRGGAILFDGTEDCSVKDCVFEGLGGNAIMFSNYNKGGTVTGCHIYNIGANAVSFIGDMKAVRSPSFGYENFISYALLDKTPGALTQNYPRECFVHNNLMHDLGSIEKQATGVQLEVASSITISHNSIYNTPRAGINIGDGCFGGHILEFNDVFNTVQETGDHGSFNSWGRDRFWAPDRNYMDSLVAVHPELILLDAQKTTIIRNNRFRCDHGWDIDLDDGSSNYHIYNNLLLNGGLKFREGFYRKAENNILINNTFHPHVWFKNSGDVFKHNIVMKPYAPIQVNYWGDSIDYNFFTDRAALNFSQANGTDQRGTVINLQFVNPQKGDFRLVPNSEALKLGFKNFSMDKFGVVKPSLKKIALQPQIPTLNFVKPPVDNETMSFLGGILKSISGLADRSAYGLPDENGVVVISLENKSLLDLSGFRKGDVIRTIDDTEIKNIRELIGVYESVKNFKSLLPIMIIRNQQIRKIELRLK